MLKCLCFIQLFLIIPSLYSQGNHLIPGTKWTIKLGLSVIKDRIVNEPISSGRGLGCSFSSRLDTKTELGTKMGFFYHIPVNKRGLSVIIGPEILFYQGKRNYATSFNCIRGLVSESKGILNFQKITTDLISLIRWEFNLFSLFIELGGYFDLGLGNTSIYNSTETTYLNEMFQPYPEPLVKATSTSIEGSSYGFIFGIGKNKIPGFRRLGVRVQYYLNISPTVKLTQYKYLSQSMMDVSFNYLLW